MRIAPLFLAAALVASLAASASAQAVLRYSWGDDANVVVTNQDWGGPAIYSQIFSVTGLSGTFDQITVVVTGPLLPEAWLPLQWFSFTPSGNWGGDDCLGTPSLTVGAVVPGAEVIPGALLDFGGSPGVTNHMTTWQYHVDISPPLVADPSKRYGIGRVSCDLQHASATYQAGWCGGANQPMCFRVEGASAHRVGPPDQWAPIMLGVDDIVYWNNSAGLIDCLSVTPARTSTWGELKTRYR